MSAPVRPTQMPVTPQPYEKHKTYATGKPMIQYPAKVRQRWSARIAKPAQGARGDHL